MGTCRICQQECSEDQQVCSNCGYPLTTFPPTLGEIPQAFQEVLSQRERWEKEIWQKHEQLQRQYTEISRNYQQLQQQFDKQQQEANNNTQLQQQIAQLKRENATLSILVESYNQSQQSQQQLIEQLREVSQESQRRQSQENSQSYQQLQQQIDQLKQENATEGHLPTVTWGNVLGFGWNVLEGLVILLGVVFVFLGLGAWVVGWLGG